MAIKVGDKLPEAKFRVMTADGLQVKTTDDVFKGKKVALFAVPGAYTGTCHKMHLPSIFLNAYALKDKGVNTIAIVSVNDAFVMNAWKRDTDQRDEATFLADGNAEFTKAIGMELDASGNGLGIRSHRYSMLVDDGVVKKLNLEPAPGTANSATFLPLKISSVVLTCGPSAVITRNLASGSLSPTWIVIVNSP